jgi:hypothetical protein
VEAAVDMAERVVDTYINAVKRLPTSATPTVEDSAGADGTPT